MADSTPPTSSAYGGGWNELTWRYDDTEFDELFQLPRSLKEKRSKSNIHIGGQSGAALADPLAEIGRHLSDMSGRIFGYDDLAEDPLLRRTLGLSPPAGSIAPVSTSSNSRPNQGSTSFQTDPVAPATDSPTKRLPALSQGTPQSTSAASDPSVEQCSKWWDEKTPGSSTAPLRHPQNSQFDQLSSEPNVHSPPTLVHPPRSTSHREDEMESSPVDENLPSPQNHQPERPAQPRYRHGQGELVDFPPYKEELPTGISLEQICQDYPNHIKGRYLRRFINDGWNARKIWATMKESAKESRSSTRPWNKFEHRLLKEKKRMAEERTAGAGGQSLTLSVQSNSDQVSRDPAMPARPSRALSDRQLDTIPVQSMASASTTNSPGRSTDPQGVEGTRPSLPEEARFEAFRRLFMAEVQKQRNLLSAILSMNDRGYHSRSAEEKSRRSTDEWIRRAKRFERTFASDIDFDLEQLLIEQTSIAGMMRRLNILVQKWFLVLRRGGQTSQPGRTGSSDVERRVVILREQLVILQGWTTTWREQVREHTRHRDGAGPQASTSVLPDTNRIQVHGQAMGGAYDQLSGGLAYAQSQSLVPELAGGQGSANAIPPNYFQQLETGWHHPHSQGPNVSQSPSVGQRATALGAGDVSASGSGPHAPHALRRLPSAFSHNPAPDPPTGSYYGQFSHDDGRPRGKWYGENPQDAD